MSEIVVLQAAGREGNVPVELRVHATDPPSIGLAIGGQGSGTYSGDNLFVALMNLRLALENRGYLLCCQGARPEVFPSGMLQQFSGGRHAYVLRSDQEMSNAEVVDVLAPAKAHEVGTVAEQRARVFQFFELGDPPA